MSLELDKAVALILPLIFGAGTIAYIALIVRIASGFTRSTSLFRHEKRRLIKAGMLFQVALYAWTRCNTAWSWKIQLLVHVAAAVAALLLAASLQRHSRRHQGGLPKLPLFTSKNRSALLAGCMCAMMFVL